MELGLKAAFNGKGFAYQVRFQYKVLPDTKIKLLTGWIFASRNSIRTNSKKYDHNHNSEAYEGSLLIIFLLGLIKINYFQKTYI